MTRRRVLRYIDLFCGAGGLAQGFRQASDERVEFRSVFGVDHDKAAAATYRANFAHDVFDGAIEELDLSILPKADLIVGGPPCQGFSPLGKMSGSEHHARMNKLWRYYFKLVRHLSPEAFVVENVPEFLKSQEFLEVSRTARDLGYRITFGVLNAADFGVPQLRRRGFVVGMKKREPRLPHRGISDSTATVKDAIWDLRNNELVYDFAESSNGDASAHLASELHIGRRPTAKSMARYRCIPPGGNRFDLQEKRRDLAPACWLRKKTGTTDVMGRLEWDKPSLTIRTEFFKPEKGRYLHPQLHRPITHWEAARIQTFPDDFKFCGSKIEIAKQIGNAVPPKLAEAVARAIKAVFLEQPASKALRPQPALWLAEQLSLV